MPLSSLLFDYEDMRPLTGKKKKTKKKTKTKNQALQLVQRWLVLQKGKIYI